MATTIGIPIATAPRMSPAAPGEHIASPVAPVPAKRERLVSLDVFRGLTIAAMLLVNNPGTWGAIYPPLEHAAWNAITSKVTGPQEREVRALVTAGSSAESILSIVPLLDGVTIDIIGTDGRLTPVGAAGVRVARTTGGTEFSTPVRLRLRSGNPELLEQAARAPVSLIVALAAR